MCACLRGNCGLCAPPQAPFHTALRPVLRRSYHCATTHGLRQLLVLRKAHHGHVLWYGGIPRTNVSLCWLFFFFFFSECDGAPWPKVVGIEESAKRSLFFKVVCREYLGHGGLSTLATTIIAVCTTFVSLWVPQFGSLKTLFQKTDLETKSRTINNNYTTLLPDEKSHGGLCMYTTRIIHCRKKMTRFVRFWAVIQKTFPPKHGKTFPPKHGRIT